MLMIVAATAASAFTLSGRVVDRATKSPIAGARIEALGRGASTSTNASGYYTLSGVGTGVYQIRVSANNYATEEQSINFVFMKVVRDFSLQPVSSGSTSKPSTTEPTQTGQSSHPIPPPPTGSTTTGSGSTSTSGGVVTTSGRTIIVVDESGRPISGATIRVIPGSLRLITNANGVATVGSIPDRKYKIHVSAPGYKKAKLNALASTETRVVLRAKKNEGDREGDEGDDDGGKGKGHGKGHGNGKGHGKHGGDDD
jgi:hypothetical protein